MNVKTLRTSVEPTPAVSTLTEVTPVAVKMGLRKSMEAVLVRFFPFFNIDTEQLLPRYFATFSMVERQG